MKEGKRPSEDEIAEERIKSDAKLIREGAHIKEGRLEVMEDQIEKADKEMLADQVVGKLKEKLEKILAEDNNEFNRFRAQGILKETKEILDGIQKRLKDMVKDWE